jgi:AcrR family transcriptional regulator
MGRRREGLDRVVKQPYVRSGYGAIVKAGQVTRRGADARTRAVDAGERLFAERGLYGTSVRDLAAELGVPTASLLHHFPRKEALYRAVLERIASDLDRVVARAIARRGDHAARLRALVRAFASWSHRSPRRSNLLLRELIDNPGRIGSAEVLPLAPVVDRMSAFLREGARARAFRRVDPILFIVHLAGSIAYFVASRPTFARLADRRDPSTFYRAYAADLVELAGRALLRNEIR